MKFSLSLLAAVAAAVIAEKVSYDGAQAIRISVGKQAIKLNNIIESLDLPTWKGIAKGTGLPAEDGHVDLVVPAAKAKEFKSLSKGFKIEVMHEDLGASIAAESGEATSRAAEVSAAAADISYFNNYHPYAEHLTFLNQLVAQYPTQSEIITAGNSVQGRPITGIHFWGSGGKGSKPAIVLHGQVHAREWVTGVTTEFLAFNLLTNYASNAEIKGFVDKYDFYIMPQVNPDGIIYTQTTDRLWRKNRQTVSTSTCVGRDVNRNWPWQWAVTGGASTNPCDETYKGLAAGDAVENRALLAQINALQAGRGVQLYIDIHSYSQLFMTPYGYSCTARATNNSRLQTLAAGFVAAVRAVSGTVYTYGPICSTIYQATGSSVDYVQDVTKAKHVFTIELRDTGRYGFVLPASQILPTARETYAGLRYLLINMQ